MRRYFKGIGRNKILVAIIAALSFIAAIFYNELNRSALIETRSELLRCNQTVVTADDISYIRPAQNFIDGKGWKANSVGYSKYFLRPPGYGIFYAVFYWAFGYENGLKALKIAQVLLFTLSVFCFFHIANALLKNIKISYFLTMMYGMTPFASGFLYYTLSESITPAFMLFYVFYLTKAAGQPKQNDKTRSYLYAALLLAFLILTRPVLAIFGTLLPVYLYHDYYRPGHLKMLLQKFLIFGCLSCSLIGCWEFRNYLIAGKYVGLHPIYFEDENSIFRPIHQGIWNFASGWGMTGQEFHGLIVPIWEAGIHGKEDATYIHNFIKAIPEYVIEEENMSTIKDAFESYHNTVADQRYYYEKNIPMPAKLLVSESIALEKFKNLADHFRQKHLVIYFVTTPFKRFREMAFHSNLSLNVFQHKYRGNVFMEFLRLFFFVLHSLIFILFLLNLILIKDLTGWMTFAFCLFIYIFFLIYFIGGLEERYTLPILPFLMIGSAYAVKVVIEKTRNFLQF